MNESFFNVDSATYAYLDIGDKGKEVLVLLHGFTGTKQTWSPFFSQLEKYFRVIAIDMPGHGNSTIDMPITMETFCHHLFTLLEKENCTNIHLLGYSMGGRSALSFAMMHESMVKTLLLESASPGLKTEKERKLRRDQDSQLAEKLLTSSIEDFVNKWEQIPLFASQKSLPKSVQQKIRRERLLQEPEGLSNSLKYMGTGIQPSWWKPLNHLNTKVLLVVGELDEKFVQINRQMHELLPHSRLEVVKEAGHAIHVEQEAKFVKLVIDFIKNEKGLS